MTQMSGGGKFGGGGSGGGLAGGGGETVSGGLGEQPAPGAERPKVRPEELDDARAETEAELAARLAQRDERIAELESALDDALAALAQAELSAAIDAAVADAGAIDPETVRLLIERELSAGGSADASEAAGRLREAKPFLFRGRSPGRARRGGGAMSAALERAPARESLDGLASKARSSGDRAELLRYLRERRLA